MAQFDVYKNNNEMTNKKTPYLLDIQNDFLSSLNTRVVIPLVIDNPKLNNLTKQLEVKNQKVYLQTSQMGTIFKNQLNTKIVSLKHKSEEIKNSIDFLIYGF